MSEPFRPIKLFTCDLNFSKYDTPAPRDFPSAPHDWAFIDPEEYFRWHVEFGVNIIFCHAFTFSGYAFYPTRLGAVAPGPGSQLLPRLYELSRKAGLPFCTYFNCTADLHMSNLRDEWLVPTSRSHMHFGLFAPESPWTDLLCARVEELLRRWPVEWINFDWFAYGSVKPDEFAVQPAWFVREPFREIIGRPMPERAEGIRPEESLAYKREILTRFFRRITDAMHRGNPGTRAFFNVPYWKPREALWVDHPMLLESDMLVAESTDEIVDWLLSIRKPHQRVMTTIAGRGGGLSQPSTWRRWYERGCDFFGYAWATPPDFRPHPLFAADVETTRAAYHEMP